MIYILSLRHYLACRGMKPMMNFFFRGWTFFPKTKGRSVVQPRPQAEAKQADRRSREKKKSNQGNKKFIKGFSFLYSSQISCLRRQIHFFTQLPYVQPSVLGWLTYFIYPWFFNLPSILSFKVSRSSPENSCYFPNIELNIQPQKFLGVPLKIAGRRPAIF